LVSLSHLADRMYQCQSKERYLVANIINITNINTDSIYKWYVCTPTQIHAAPDTGSAFRDIQIPHQLSTKPARSGGQ